MKRFYFFISLFFVLCAPLRGEEDEIIRVELEKESQLSSVYIENTKAEDTRLTQDYCSKIESILRFNFAYNGRSYVVSQKKMGDHSYQKNRPLSYFKDHGVEYLFKLKLRGNYLTVSAYSLLLDKVCFAEDIKLIGKLEEDRQKIHKCSMNIHQALFQEEGIYLSQLMYTLKTKSALFPNQPWISEVYLCDWDGGNERQITHENNYCVTPTCALSSPNAQKGPFFYVSYKMGQPKIFWSSLSQYNPKRLTYLKGNQFMPAISPKGNQIAFINDAPGNPELFVQDFDPYKGAMGKPKQIFSCKRGVQASPTYSPDGKKIAFVSNKDGSPRIYVMKVPHEDDFQKREKPTLITRKNYENTKPSWSPDGKKLAYIARVEGVRQIWIYDFETKKEHQLTYGPGNKENPIWAPNSLHLAFNSVGNSSCELYLVNLNQPEAVRIIPSQGLKRFPYWVQP